MWAQKRPTKQARATFWSLYNVCPQLVLEAFEYHGIIRLTHPSESPDLSPAGFWLFGYIKATLEGFFFQDINEARDRIVAILRSIPSGDCYPGIRRMQEQIGGISLTKRRIPLNLEI
jgi:hypothetical protein